MASTANFGSPPLAILSVAAIMIRQESSVVNWNRVVRPLLDAKAACSSLLLLSPPARPIFRAQHDDMDGPEPGAV